MAAALTPELAQCVLVPEELPPDAAQLPELLRTKPLPEQETEARALLTLAARSADEALGGAGEEADEARALRVANHNAALADAAQHYDALVSLFFVLIYINLFECICFFFVSF